MGEGVPLLDRVAGSVCGVATAQPVFHLSFDDGPHPEVTPRVLDLLDEFRASATFFVLTDHAYRYPDVVEETLRRGHEVGLHGRTHLRLSTASWKSVLDEVLRARDDLEELIRREVRFFRPPYGDHGLRSFAVAKAIGLKTILWSVDSYDWKGIRHEASLRSVIEAMRPGGVGLMHDTTIGETLDEERARGLIPRDEVVGQVLQSAMERGLRLVSLADLVSTGPVISSLRPTDRPTAN